MLKSRLGFFTTHGLNALWLIVCASATIAVFFRNSHALNNYHVYKGVYWHLLNQQDLFMAYPAQHLDLNHYGPVFGLLIAPFALLPDQLGCFLWCMANAGIFLYAIRLLNLKQSQQHLILLITIFECVGALQNQQFNPMLTAFIIIAFVLVQQKQEFMAALLVMIGLFVKLYGVVGLFFVFFSPRPWRYAGALLFWLIVLFTVPALLSSWHYNINAYKGWLQSLKQKDQQNSSLTQLSLQDISLMGFVRRITGLMIPNWAFLIPAGLISLIPVFRTSQHPDKSFRHLFLAQLLMTLVLFSSSSESPTYVIAVAGAAIWFVMQPRPLSNFTVFLISFMMVLTSISYTDFVPRGFREDYIVRYSLKALPIALIWIANAWQLAITNFPPTTPRHA